MRIDLPFDLSETVFIDGDRTIRATVTAFTYRGAGLQAEVCWFANGVQQCVWVDVWRLEHCQ